MLEEMKTLETQGVHLHQRLFISEQCTIILPSHIALDKAREAGAESLTEPSKQPLLSESSLSDQQHYEQYKKVKIGTTCRGIGPAYEDKIGRRGIRLADLFQERIFAAKLQSLLQYHNFLLQHYYQVPTIDYQETFAAYVKYGSQLKPYTADISSMLEHAGKKQQPVLFEGAQGAMLDIDHGTYPYVTASSTLAAAAATGSGVGPAFINKVLGITKSYTTRVGEGPFPTELFDETGHFLAEKGKEFGATTGRPRRCGWLDLTALKKTIRLNSVDALAITKLDVLDGLPQVKLAINYDSGNKPVYETLPGWQQQTTGVTTYQELPAEAQAFIRYIEHFLAVPVAMISTGPDRKDIVILNPVYDSKPG